MSRSEEQKRASSGSAVLNTSLCPPPDPRSVRCVGVGVHVGPRISQESITLYVRHLGGLEALQSTFFFFSTHSRPGTLIIHSPLQNDHNHTLSFMQSCSLYLTHRAAFFTE